jgi:hypothetical protein
MNPRQFWGKFSGLGLHALISVLLIVTGSEKLLRAVPPQPLVKYGLAEQTRLIGAGAVLTALLLLIPRTSPLGVLVASSFWGGAICIHMAHHEPYVFQSLMVVLTWVGACLRNPPTMNGFSGSARGIREPAVQKNLRHEEAASHSTAGRSTNSQLLCSDI